MIQNLRRLKEHYRKFRYFKNYDFIDKVNIYHNEIIILSCVIFVCLYMTKIFSTIRNTISDTITFSSIILGILGVLIGILIGLEENSTFFKKAKKFDKSKSIYSILITKMRNAFLTNIVFVAFTIAFDMMPSINMWVIKTTVLFIWGYLFLKTIWQVWYLIILIVKIAVFVDQDSPSNNKKS
ncbi:hypothetical protein EFK95_00345 [Lactococcus lactis subsp. lactis]|uniref:hypothetical protein n=1 Tax=Lactococcus lactis TaxID=1358 RepID=UPI0021A735F0|nr:hypothetical protein [Lactococcus lactis]MCT0078053.1 hypothetical protein [Lactococcus lactis subsp. lactis]